MVHECTPFVINFFYFCTLLHYYAIFKDEIQVKILIIVGNGKTFFLCFNIGGEEKVADIHALDSTELPFYNE